MNTRRLRWLGQLMFEWELLCAINWRDHNPVYRNISRALEGRVDRALGFDGAPAFSPEDDLQEAILKSSRNRIVAENFHRAVVEAIGSPSYEQITSTIRQVVDGEAMRLAQRFGVKALLRKSDGFLIFLLLAGYYSARQVQRSRSLWRHQIRRWRQTWAEQRAFWKEYAASVGKLAWDARPVMIVIRKDWPQVGYPSGRIVKELLEASVPVCCVLADGFDPRTASVMPHGWEWLREVKAISVPELPYPLHDWLTDALLPQVPKRYRARGFRKLPSGSGLRTKFRQYAQEFVFAANCVDFLTESIRPRSVLNMAGDKNIYGQAISYCCLKSGIPVHSYYPLILYPTGMQSTRLTPSTLVVSKLDIPSGENGRSGRSYSVVGSPLFDDHIPPGGEADGEGNDALRLVYFTKRIFPNFEVLSQIKRTLDQLGRKFHIVIKPHPTDTESDYQHLPSILQKDEYTYVGANEIESVDGCIARSDIVVSGPSNVIWSALRQRKPVIYLNFTDVGDHHYPQAYGRYATVPFVTAWAISEVGEALRRILQETDGGRAPTVDQAKFQALMEDVFHGGGGSARRIADLLM